MPEPTTVPAAPMVNEGWTVGTLKGHYDALEVANQAFQSERDRRYSEVKAAEEKALKVKEVADAEALKLAREIQDYKDKQTEKLREQLSSENNMYATKDDLVNAIKEVMARFNPVIAYVENAQGGSKAITAGWAALGVVAMIAINLASIFAR